MNTLLKSMPSQGLDLKQGVYRTPKDFMGVVKKEYPISFDLAASEDNAQSSWFLDEEADAFSKDWGSIHNVYGGYLWLNPPYDDIGKWAERCAVESVAGAKILMLVPASVGSNWYRGYVEGFAKPRFLTGRLVFEFLYPEDYKDKKTGLLSPKAGKPNTDPYPKDLLLAVFDSDIPLDERHAETWQWGAYL